MSGLRGHYLSADLPAASDGNPRAARPETGRSPRNRFPWWRTEQLVHAPDVGLDIGVGERTLEDLVSLQESEGLESIQPQRSAQTVAIKNASAEEIKSEGLSDLLVRSGSSGRIVSLIDLPCFHRNPQVLTGQELRHQILRDDSFALELHQESAAGLSYEVSIAIAEV
nr:hypothetical protein [Aquisphaera insulae]